MIFLLKEFSQFEIFSRKSVFLKFPQVFFSVAENRKVMNNDIYDCHAYGSNRLFKNL